MLKKILSGACVWALCLALALSPALAEGSAFTLMADVHAENWPEELRALAEGLSSLCAVTTVSGTCAAQGEAFELDADVAVSDQHVPMNVQGVPSHWRVTTPLLGDVPLLVNNLALLEFGLKAEDHLGIALQKAGLLVPYAHTSAWDAMADVLSPLLPAEDGEYRLTGDEAAAVLSALADMAETDRTVRCYFEALGIDAGLLDDELAAVLAAGVTVSRTGGNLTWRSGEQTLLDCSMTDEGISLAIRLGVLDASIRLARTDGIFVFTADAQGALLAEEYHLHASGTVDADGISITLMNRERLPLATLTVSLAPWEPDSLPTHTAADLSGVNVLSLNGDSLSALMAQAGPSLLSGGLALVAACPAEAVQSLMDALDESGVIPLLTDALMHTSTEY